jgi:hypothetical protein
MGTFLEKKVFYKSKFSKNFFYEIWSPNPMFVFFGKIRPILILKNV